MKKEGGCESSILCSSFAMFGIILFLGGGFQASWGRGGEGGVIFVQ